MQLVFVFKERKPGDPSVESRADVELLSSNVDYLLWCCHRNVTQKSWAALRFNPRKPFGSAAVFKTAAVLLNKVEVYSYNGLGNRCTLVQL